MFPGGNLTPHPIPPNEVERLNALRRYNILDTPPEETFDRITALAARLFDVPIALVSLVDEFRAWFKSCYGFDTSELPRDATICSFAVLYDDVLVVPDTKEDPRFACKSFAVSEPGIRFYAGAPLITHDGFNLGTLCLVDSKPHPQLSKEQQATLGDLAAMVVDELELRLAVTKVAEMDTALLEITRGVSAATGEAFFASLVKHLTKALDVQYAFVGELLGAGEAEKIKTLSIHSQRGSLDNVEYSLINTPCKQVIRQGKPCCYPRNVQAHFPGNHLLPQMGVDSYVATPLLDSTGCVRGLLGVMSQKPLENTQLAELLLTIFATRAVAELERKQAEEERTRLLKLEQKARTEAETANRLKDEFLALLSHELRSPLNPILGWSKLLKSRSLDPAKTIYALETIERNAKLQSQLIEDLLDVSRILQGKLNLNVCPVDLTFAMDAALETVQLAAAVKSISIQKVYSTGGQVIGDSNRLQQIFWNLLSNAVKFTPAGGSVQVQMEDDGDRAKIQVSDTGKGIEPDFLPYVFDYFRQADSTTTRTFGGLGLGLAIVRYLVELHGGTVSAQSPGVGLGATFTVVLPVKSAAPLVNEVISPQTLPNLDGIQVVVVDDEVDSRELIGFILQEFGASVRTFSSAFAALEAFKIQPPDVIISDIGMPSMDGYMLMRKIRSLPIEQGRKVKAIALTAYAGETDRQQVLLAGFEQYITKPLDPGQLVQAIANLCIK